MELSAAGPELQQCKQCMLVGRRIIVTLKPRASTEDTYPVSCYYEMKSPGSYAVELQRELPESLGVNKAGSQRSNDRALKVKNRLLAKTPLHGFLIESKVETEKPLTVLALEL
jgi:hypothetical protein